MSFLKPGTLCVIVGGCPGNIGLIVEVLAHLGPCGDRTDAYHVRTASGRPFAQLWVGSGSRRRLRNEYNSNECITDRHKLRPLVNLKPETEERACERPTPCTETRTAASGTSSASTTTPTLAGPSIGLKG